MRFPEATQPRGEFKVTAKGADLAYRWLQTIKKAYDVPFIPSKITEDAVLELGRSDVHNSLIHLILPGIIFIPSNNFQLATRIVGKESRENIGGGLFDVLEFSLTRRGYAPVRQVDEEDSLPEIRDITKALGRRLTKDGFKLSLETDGMDVILIRKKTDLNAEPHKVIKVEMGGKEVYSLEIKAPLGDPAQFDQRYSDHAILTQHVVNAIYETKGEYAPDKTLEIAPTDETESVIGKLEAMLRLEKQKLSMAGLDDGTELEEEIKRKINEIRKPTDTFEDVGGAEDAKAELETMAYSLLHPDDFRSEGTLPPRRVLLFGPSGTGKTLLARALANKANCEFLPIEIADIVNSLYGRSEKFIQKMFDVARERTPIILFIDEMDAIALHRDHADQLMARIVNVLLTNLDGMRGRDDGVMVVGTTNRLSSIDTALLRPGRFDTLVEVKIPNDKGRKSIFKIHMDKAMQVARKELFDPNINLDALVGKTDGFSGDDIREIITRALRVRVERKRAGLSVPLTTTEDIMKKIADYESVRIARQKEIGFVRHRP